MKKILIFQLKKVCYDSYTYFSSQIGSFLEKNGYDVTYFQLGRDGSLADIEQFAGQSFDAVLEFNSDLPKIRMEDGSYFLSQIDAPFIDFILDHPLYHHDSLKQDIGSFYVCCLDANHRDYILENYPHISDVFVLPVTGSETAEAVPYDKREIPLLFSGTYTSPAEVWEAIKDCPGFIGADIRRLIEMMLADSSLTLEHAVHMLAEESDSLIEANFPLHMQAYFLADTYLRAYTRDQVIRTLLSHHIPLTIYGGEWEKLTSSLSAPEAASLTLHPGVPFTDSFTLMAHAKITLNVMPLFKAGAHDRIFSAQLNHCVCLTDPSTYLLDCYTDRKDIVFYDLMQPDSLLSAIDFLFHNETAATQIATCGYQNAHANHSWENYGQQLLHFLDSITG